MAEFEVAIVGAGPAGAAAAIALARLGRRVALIDKAQFPRDKCCGDGLTTGALRHLEELGVRPERVASFQPVRAAQVRVPDGRSACFELPGDGSLYVAAARRWDLDAALVDRAVEEGATLMTGHALGDARWAGSRRAVELTLAGGGSEGPSSRTVSASYVIGADGMWSPLRRLLAADAPGLDVPGYRGEWHAVRQYFSGVGPLAEDMWVWFEPDILPGYVWSFPLAGGAANVGFGILRPDDDPNQPTARTGQLKHLWADILARPHIAEVLGSKTCAESAWKSWPIPARLASSRLDGFGGRVLFVGDAARASDVMTGEGIAQAFDTAILAATSIDRAGPHQPSVAAADYRRRIRMGMAMDDRLSRRLSRVMAHRRGANGWLPIATHSERSRQLFTRWMFEDFPRAFFLTPQRWRRDLGHRPGAYAGAGQATNTGAGAGQATTAGAATSGRAQRAGTNPSP